MAEELVLTVKSNVSTVTEDVEKLTSSIDQTKHGYDELGKSISASRDHIQNLEKTLIELKQVQDSIPKDAWWAGRDDLNKRIRETSDAITLEKSSLKGLNNRRKDATSVINKNIRAQKRQNVAILRGIGRFRIMGVSIHQISRASKAVIPSIKLMFTSIKMGIASTGIGLLVIAIGLLVTWLMNSSKVGKFFASTFKTIGVVVSVVVDRITAFGDAVSKIFSGDWAGAWSDMKAAVSGVGDEMAREIKLAKELKESQDLLLETERALKVEAAEKAIVMDELLRIAGDETRTQQDRLDALEEARNIEVELDGIRLQAAETHLSNLRTELSLDETKLSLLDDIADAEVALANLRRDAAGKEAAHIKRVDGLRKKTSRGRSSRAAKAAKKEQDIAKASVALHNKTIAIMQNLYYAQIKDEEKLEKDKRLHELNRAEKEIDLSKATKEKKDAALIALASKYDEDIKAIEEKFRLEREAKAAAEATVLLDIQDANRIALLDSAHERATEELKIQKKKDEEAIKDADNKAEMQIAIDKKYKGLKKKLDDEETDRVKAKTAAELDANLAAFSQLSNALSTMAGDNKELAAAGAIIDTWAGATKAFKQGGTLGFVTGAAVLAAGFNNVRQIYATDVGGAGGGGAAPTETLPPAPEMMSGAFTLGGGQPVEPARAYVVSDDITANQNKLAIIRRRATI